MAAIAAWSIKLEPGKPQKFESPVEDGAVSLKITNASLGETLKDTSGRSVVKLTLRKSDFDQSEDEEEEDEEEPQLTEVVLVALTAGKTEQVSLNVEFTDELVQFEVIGKNEVHLLGNWVDRSPEGPDMFDSEDEDEEEDGLRLEDVSSDVEVEVDHLEMDEDTDAERFEEVQEKSLKRSADALDADVSMTDDKDKTLSKSQKKKQAKKLKTENGAVEAPSAEPTSEKKKEKKDKTEKTATAPAGAVSKKTLDGGLIVEDAKVGTGKAAKRGNTLSMRYIGKLTNGKIFDKNSKGKPFTFTLGKGEVIKGWDQGLVGMQVGGERKLTIPAPLGYGASGQKPDIPGNATLVFDVKLLEIK
ncbi:hypothetical protein SISNIDRAFT_492825 [Sistotremastrum niveocremeum HHB9708]|uniref:FK506-binding protein n=2 Tax=Sistotremastraceae TaxID=3402574 RepID=A0A165A7D9_9AGAM|nr:hypothetical protein SISNIDRAFT_492825 [Sistotremastrum niveocremeum HHB9708]KZT43491.1 hypothetical protein SISSUDRAFT_997095 [Sistotremastrum suecicum HHB10207 ss-3]